MSAWILRDLATDLGLALLHSLWQVSLIALALWCLLTLLHQASPRLRHGLAFTALMLAVAWPSATFVRARGARADLQRSVESGSRPLASTPQTRRPGIERLLYRAHPALPFLAAAWVLGALVLGLRLLGGWVWLSRLHDRTALAPEVIQVLGRRLAERMGIQFPELRVAEHLGPFSYGLFRTVVVLPAACLGQMDAIALEAVLAHEFAHLRRLDFLLNAIQSTAEVLLFHHPLARWISEATRLERERCCDEAAVALCGDARSFAAALLQLDELRPPSLALAAHGAPLMTRLRFLLGSPLRPSLISTFAATLLLGGLTLSAAAPFLRDKNPTIVSAPATLVSLADRIAAAEGVDPYLVRAVIQCESRFENLKTPNVMGSVGLMQLIPKTAARFGVTDPTDPTQNITGGVKYLRFLLDHYRGNTALAVMAYNAGEQAVDRADGIAPTEESRTYALAVMDLYKRKAVEPAGSLP